MKVRGNSNTPRAKHPQKHPTNGIPRNSLPQIRVFPHPHPPGIIYRPLRRLGEGRVPTHTEHSTAQHLYIYRDTCFREAARCLCRLCRGVYATVPDGWRKNKFRKQAWGVPDASRIRTGGIHTILHLCVAPSRRHAYLCADIDGLGEACTAVCNSLCLLSGCRSL